VGVGAFAHSAATGGREGGPAEVQAFQENQQKEQMRAQESQQSAQRNQREQTESDLRNQAMRAQMSVGAFQLENMRQNAPLDIQRKQNEIAEQQLTFMQKLSETSGLPLMVINSMANDDTKTTLAAMNDKATTSGTTIHDTMWTHVQNDHGPGNGSKVVGLDLGKFGNTIIKPELADIATLPIKSQLDLGANVLGEDNPVVKGARQYFAILQQGLNSGQVSVNQLALAKMKIEAPIGNAMGVKHATAAAQKEQAEATRAQQEANPAFQVQLAGAKKGAEAAAELPFAARKAAAEQSVRQGDPNAAGALLADGSLTLSELKSRGTTPDFIVQATKAAQKVDPTYNPQKAEADFNIAKSEDNNKFFGAANSLLGKNGSGGNLDLLAQKYKALKNGNIPLFNKVADYAKAGSGDPALAGFVQAAIGVADDYAKVMGGGTGSDSSRLQLLQSFSNAHNPEQMKNAIRTAKQALSSQAESRIGNNKILKQMYGGAVVPPAPQGAVGIAPGSDGNDYYHDAQGKPLGIAP
jgi:hypothetical protein